MTTQSTPCQTPYLGHITRSQFQRALDVFSLGTLRDVSVPERGLSGQTVMLRSSEGTYYLRGRPRTRGQFQKEQFFTNELHERTDVPVPHPYMLSTDTNIFGWEFGILPGMPGHHFFCHDPSKLPFRLTDSDWHEIVWAQGRILREAQRVTHSHCGEYDPVKKRIKRYPTDWPTYFKKRIVSLLSRLSEQGPETPRRDVQWAATIIEEAAGFVQPFTPCVFFQDFKHDNMLIDRVDSRWRITALLDFAYASVGHPEADLARTFIYYSTIAPHLAKQFIDAYFDGYSDKLLFAQRFPLFILYDRTLAWNSLLMHGQDTSRKTFKEWVSEFLRYGGTL